MNLFTGVEYLQIDIANNFGLDKLNWEDRISWFHDNENQLDKLILNADNPALFYAGVQAWNKHKLGKPSGYPISLDATASGAQLLAILTGDYKGASICNVVDTGKREDAYTAIYEAMLVKTKGEARIDRKDTKQAIMTGIYGSQAIPKEVFGTGKLYSIYEQTMEENMPGAWEFMKASLAVWDSEWIQYGWVMPDNFHVKCKVQAPVTQTVNFLEAPFTVTTLETAPLKEGRAIGANIVHSVDGMIVRELVRRCTYSADNLLRVIYALNNEGSLNIEDDDADMVRTLWNQYKQTGFLSARILDHIKAGNTHLVDLNVIWNLIDSMPHKPFDVITVHDCFRCLPNYGNDLRKQYNRILYDLAQSDLLSNMLSQLTQQNIEVNKLETNWQHLILEANYSLT